MRLPCDHQSLKYAAKALWDGQLVSFPTETVYGLGADATNDKAVASIYEAKGRPSFNPLIAHIASLEMAHNIAEFTPLADKIAALFWPGAVTMILPLKMPSAISKLVTAGLDTIALRMPAPLVARELLQLADRPIAAPSANLSGGISPTLASHVEADLGDKCAYILDGGACEQGLESTIIDCTSDKAVILRPGPVTFEALQKALPDYEITYLDVHNDEAPSAPGQLTSHYAPSKAMRLNAQNKKAGEILIGFGDIREADYNLSPSGDLTEAAANLFALLHKADKAEGTVIAVSPVPQSDLGIAIYDRLRRAAAEKDKV